jgi:hypothetical protein
LGIQFLCRGCTLLRTGGGLLSHLLHLDDGPVNLLDTPGLLLASRVQIFHQNPKSFRFFGNPAHSARHLVDLVLTLMRFRNRFFDQVRSIASRLGASLRQIANLIRHHREAQPGISRPRRFHGRVQRQDVGLEGNLIDHFDDPRNAVRMRFDFAHRDDCLVQ